MRAEIDWLANYRKAREGQFSDLVIFMIGALVFAPFVAFVVFVQSLTLPGGANYPVTSIAVGIGIWCLGAFIVTLKARDALRTYLGAVTLATLFAAVPTLTGDVPIIVALVFAGVGVLSFFMLRGDARTRMYLRLPVTDDELRRYFKNHGSNEMAAAAAALAVFAFCFPVIAVFSFLLGIGGLLRVRNDTEPPVGGLTDSLFAITVSVAAIATWAAIIRMK